jgi:hypothetical protein
MFSSRSIWTPSCSLLSAVNISTFVRSFELGTTPVAEDMSHHGLGTSRNNNDMKRSFNLILCSYVLYQQLQEPVIKIYNNINKSNYYHVAKKNINVKSN